MAPKRKFATGSTIPASGIYRVTHAAHRLPHEVTLICGDTFPRCAKCSDKVKFVLLRAVPANFLHYPVRLYELPVVEEDEAAQAEAAG